MGDVVNNLCPSKWQTRGQSKRVENLFFVAKSVYPLDNRFKSLVNFKTIL